MAAMRQQTVVVYIVLIAEPDHILCGVYLEHREWVRMISRVRCRQTSTRFFCFRSA